MRCILCIQLNALVTASSPVVKLPEIKLTLNSNSVRTECGFVTCFWIFKLYRMPYSVTTCTTSDLTIANRSRSASL